MNGRCLVDTNVLVYAYDSSDHDKQSRALDLLDELIVDGVGFLSTQVLGEFFVVVTKKLTPRLSPGQALERVRNLARAWPVLPVTPMIVAEAARGVNDHQLSFWDAQIWATARLNQIPTVITEDFTDGRNLGGVEFINPFAKER